MAQNSSNFNPNGNGSAGIAEAMRITREQPQPATEQSVVFRPIGLPDLLNRPPKTWMIENVFGERDICMIYGPPGSAKTFVTIDLIFSACLGRQWAMRFDVERPLNVVYMAGEGLSGLPQRFAAAAEFYGVEELPGFAFFDDVPQLFDPRSATHMNQFIEDWNVQGGQQIDLLIIDTQHSAIEGADENSSRDMGQVLASVKYARNKLGCSVLLVHHTNKSGTGERGSSAMRGAMDCMIEVKRAGRKFSMQCEKLKDGEEWIEQTYDLVAKGDSVRVWWDEPADNRAEERNSQAEKIRDLLLQYIGTKLTAKAISEALGIAPNAITKTLNRMVDENRIWRGLQDAEKPNSSRNPWVYTIATDDRD